MPRVIPLSLLFYKYAQTYIIFGFSSWLLISDVLQFLIIIKYIVFVLNKFSLKAAFRVHEI